MFQARAGAPLFESFVGPSTEVLREMARISGMPPESSRSLWKRRGITITEEAEWDGPALTERIREIGTYDHEASIYDSDSTSSNCHALLEHLGRTIVGKEVQALTELLRRALDYTPERRLSAESCADHPGLGDRERSY